VGGLGSQDENVIFAVRINQVLAHMVFQPLHCDSLKLAATRNTVCLWLTLRERAPPLAVTSRGRSSLIVHFRRAG
jgi:hypothetical protein